MKKILACMLALLMLLAVPAFAEEAPATDVLTVGSTTKLSGSFFTDMWGSNTSDMDVRMLLHGYNLMEWKAANGAYGIDDSVVSGMVVTDNISGNRTYTIALYDNMAYSDGTPVTAWDYAFSLLLSVAPEVAEIGGAVHSAEYISGMDEYLAGTASALSGVRVLGDYQLAITVKAEYLPFFYEMALLDCIPYPIAVIAPGCEVADDGEGVYIRNIDESVEEPIFTAALLRETILNAETGYLSHPGVVSGPYTLASYDAQSGVAEFEINGYYKGNSAGELPQIQKLILRPVTNETMMEQLASGEIGLINKATNADALDQGMQLLLDGGFEVANYARSGYSFISYSCELPTTGSQAVRQAIAYSFDKDAFVTDYVRNYGLRVDGYYGIGQWMYQLVEGSVAAPVAEDAENAEEELLAWEALNLDGLHVYDLNLETAAKLLVGDGWTLNAEGEAFDPEKDEVRCKEIDGALVALDIELIYPEGNLIGEHIQAALADNLAKIGVKLTVEAKPFTELLRVYYRQEARECEMIYLASNFADVFEPSAVFSVADAQTGRTNRTGIADEQLYGLAVDLRRTEPGNVLEYCAKWVEMQERFTEVLPAVPVYSNVYFDFYADALQNYSIGESISWAQAIVGAYLGEPAAADELIG